MERVHGLSISMVKMHKGTFYVTLFIVGKIHEILKLEPQFFTCLVSTLGTNRIHKMEYVSDIEPSEKKLESRKINCEAQKCVVGTFDVTLLFCILHHIYELNSGLDVASCGSPMASKNEPGE